MLVYGKNVVNEILNSKTKIYKVFLDNNFNDQEILRKVDKLGLKKFHVDKNKIDKMCSNSANQGIALDIEEYEYLTIDNIVKDDNANFVVMLDSLEDPHNFGAIIRTCEAKGVKTIVIPKDRSVVVNETVMKTSSGALSNVNIVMVNNLVKSIDEFKDNGYFVYGAEANGKDYKTVDYSDKVCLVIGSEGNGISRLVVDACDEIISIPMRGKVNSLNASVAAAILIYGIGE